MERVVSEAAADIDAHLLRTLFKRFNLAEHFAAVKRYLLLGQGDFIQVVLHDKILQSLIIHFSSISVVFRSFKEHWC